MFADAGRSVEQAVEIGLAGVGGAMASSAGTLACYGYSSTFFDASPMGGGNRIDGRFERRVGGIGEHRSLQPKAFFV